MQWIAFLFIVSILIVRGILPNYFILDSFSISLLFLLSIPLVAPYLKKAKWFGAEFEFKDEIKKLNTIVEKTEQQTKNAELKGASSIRVFETFPAQSSLKLLDSDPNLSLAALRIDIEKVLSSAVNRLFGQSKESKRGNKFYVSQLLKKEVISSEQAKALNTIIEMCNRAVHGADISKNDAREIIILTERLNKSFVVGYSINFEENQGYDKQGLVCEWEHCVEYFPLEEERTALSCPIFGHDCPGGTEAREFCDRSIADISPKRFV